MRKPGHREGIRRHQRYGQLTLTVGQTLRTKWESTFFCALGMHTSCDHCHCDCHWKVPDAQAR
jgi:hypothetical protein